MRKSALAALTVLAGVAAFTLCTAAPASAHVLPTSTVILEVHDDDLDAQLRIPVTDLVSASGIDLSDGTAADLAAHDSEVAAYAVSILIAAVHAVHPGFAGREAVVAAGFGLVHGLAFSATLTGLHLSGGQLVLSLLGFNLGVELIQLIVVALVLPPLIVLARTRPYRPLRLAAAGATGIAAVGWLAQRVGFANPIASAADGIEGVSVYLVVVLWISALAVVGSARLPLTRSGRSAAGRLTGSSIRYPWENAS